MNELKERLRDLGLPVSGTKAELLKRLEPEFKFEELMADFVRQVQEEFWADLEAWRWKPNFQTQVVCVKVANIRPEYEDLKEWVEDPVNEYIGRGPGPVFIDGARFPAKSSKWANPFAIGKGSTREDVVEKYREYILRQIIAKPGRFNLEKLRDKNLGCWCAPEGCHGDVLLELLTLWEKYWAYLGEHEEEELELQYRKFFQELYARWYS